MTFYICAIFSYERFKSLLAVRRPRLTDVQGEPVASIAEALQRFRVTRIVTRDLGSGALLGGTP